MWSSLPRLVMTLRYSSYDDTPTAANEQGEYRYELAKYSFFVCCFHTPPTVHCLSDTPPYIGEFLGRQGLSIGTPS
jgi:hypothetical protein